MNDFFRIDIDGNVVAALIVSSSKPSIDGQRACAG
jgi:hypothetical protein